MAFEVLVARHGPMVLSVCRRFLREPAEVDDAFQATFLVLARRAGAIRVEWSLGPWLHGVSRRVARRLQMVSARRTATHRGGEFLDSVPDRYRCEIADIERRLDLKGALDALPAAFRDALVLCYLEGLTHDEAAEKLGCPVGTVRSRLARGRALLRQRMDTDVSGRWSPSTEANDRTESDPSSAVVAPCLIQSTARAAARLAAGHPLAGLVPARVAEVATGVLAVMFRKKLAAMAVVVVIGTLAGWGGWAAQSAPGQEGKGTGQAAIDQPPSDRLRGDFDRPKARRIVFPNPKQGGQAGRRPARRFPRLRRRDPTQAGRRGPRSGHGQGNPRHLQQADDG